MKVFCIGRNYADHAKELHNPVPQEPVIFMKPATAVCDPGINLYYPEFTDELHYECEMVLKIGKNGRNIPERFAYQYIDSWTVGIDFTARDLQQKLKKQGLPWEISKAFDHSALVGTLLPAPHLSEIHQANIALELNGVTVQQGNTADMIFPVEKIISYISKFFTLQIGDYIFTGTPAGVGLVLPYDRLTGYLNEEQLFDITLK